MDEELIEIYRQIADRISESDFLSRLDEKVALMAGLCDRRTAAMLVARDLGTLEVTTKIGNIRPEVGNVIFLGRVLSVSSIRKFQRSDGSDGKVANLTIADDTGSVRLALWDEGTDLIASGDLKVGQCLKVRGLVKEGYSGTEVSLGRNGQIEEVDDDINPISSFYKISDIKIEMPNVSFVAMVVDPGEMREFLRKDGSKGQLKAVLLGDETGKIRLNLWNEHASIHLEKGDVIEIIDVSSRERYGSIEVQTGNCTAIHKSDIDVNFKEQITPVADLKQGMICSVSGFVTGLGEVREFSRDDGKSGRVANIYISDDTGRVKVALWGDHAELLKGLDLGYKAELIDVLVKNGWNDGLELSCGWRTKITFTPPE